MMKVNFHAHQHETKFYTYTYPASNIFTPEYIPNRISHIYAPSDVQQIFHSSIFHNSPKLDMTQ